MEKNIRFSCHWGTLLALVFLWCYGFQSALYDHAYSVSSRIALSLACLGGFLLWAGPFRRALALRDSVSFSPKDVWLFLGPALVLFMLSLPDLFYALNGDQLYHSQQSQRHFTHGLQAFLSNDYLADFQYRTLLQGFGLFSTLSAFAVAWALFRAGVPLLWVGFLAFICLRISGISVNASYDPHAPFRLFPLWASSTIFSHQAFAYKLPQFLCWFAGMFSLFQIAKPRLGQMTALLFAITAGTIPLLWHVSLIVEHSIYTAMLWTCLLCHLAATDNFSDFPWVRWSALICIATLIRYPAGLALLPLGLFYLVHQKIFSTRTLWMAAPLVLLALPIILQAQLNGTPATYQGSELIPEGAGALARTVIALQDPGAVKSLYNSHALPWLICLGVILLPLRSILLTTTLLLFFAGSLVVFYSIHPGLWELSRYKTEYITPFAICGLYCLLHATGQHKRIRPLVFAALIALLLNNLGGAQTFFKEPASQVAEIPHPFDEAFKVVQAEELAAHTLVAGVTYGAFNEVLHGYSVKEHHSAQALFDKHHRFSAEAINSDVDIKLLLLDNDYHPTLADELSHLGWQPWVTFRDEKHPKGLVSYKRTE